MTGSPNIGIGSWPRRQARIRADRCAFRQGDTARTYRELAARVDRLAASFSALGVGKGDRVAYLAANDIAGFETLFAATLLGAVFVPLNWRLSPAELHFLLTDCDPSVLVHGADTAELAASSDPGVPHVVSFAGGEESAFESLVTPVSPPLPDTSVTLDDAAVILYTSGTTGRPKGAILSHGNLTFNTFNQLAHLDVISTDVVLCTAPLFHATGLGQVSLPTLFKGGTVVVAPKFDPAWMLHSIADLGITAFSGVPTMLQMLCDHPDWDGADLHTLRYVNYGGSSVLPRVAHAWLERGIRVVQGYGMTEASPAVTMEVPDTPLDRDVSAGVPHFFTDVAIAVEDGQPNDPPGTGELLVRGPHVIREYWRREAETKLAFDGDGWFRSGDVVSFDDTGSVYIRDRIKDMIISGGENIYPAEVEAAISRIAGVADCAIVAVPDERWGEVGCAFVVRRPGARVDSDEVRRQLSETIGRFKIPKYVQFVDELPRSATGKVRKTDLRRIGTELTADVTVPEKTSVKETL